MQMSKRKSQMNMDKFVQKTEDLSVEFQKLWVQIRKNKKALQILPVAIIALLQAAINLFALPALVGFGMDVTGEFAFELIREIAVIGPLLITSICLLLMYISKRTLTPCMVSWFSLLIPILILLTNTFPK